MLALQIGGASLVVQHLFSVQQGCLDVDAFRIERRAVRTVPGSPALFLQATDVRGDQAGGSHPGLRLPA